MNCIYDVIFNSINCYYIYYYYCLLRPQYTLIPRRRPLIPLFPLVRYSDGPDVTIWTTTYADVNPDIAISISADADISQYYY